MQADLYSASLFVAAVIYLIPSMIAFGGGKQNAGLIIFVNIVAGWTLIGWLLVLIWSIMGPARKPGRERFVDLKTSAPAVDAPALGTPRMAIGKCGSCGRESHIPVGGVMACPLCSTGIIREQSSLETETRLQALTRKGDET